MASGRAHPGTAPKFRAAVGRNAAFMRQGSGLTPDCRINAAFRGQCPDAPRRGQQLIWKMLKVCHAIIQRAYVVCS